MSRIARVTVAMLSGVTAPAWAEERPWAPWGMHPMWGFWGLWGVGMMLVMLVFWGLVIAVLVVGLRRLLGFGRALETGTRHDAALDILRQRYARGEISKEEFEAKKRDLE